MKNKSKHHSSDGSKLNAIVKHEIEDYDERSPYFVDFYQFFVNVLYSGKINNNNNNKTYHYKNRIPRRKHTVTEIHVYSK